MSIISELLSLKEAPVASKTSIITEGNKSFDELIEKYLEMHGYSMEGRRGLTNFCRLVAILGYKDKNYSGQLDSDASIGDLTNFLEDNSGALEAMLDFIKQFENPEWKKALEEYFTENGEGDDDDGEPHQESVQEAKVEKKYKLIMDRNGGFRVGTSTRKPIEKIGTVPELIEYAKYTLEKGKSWEHEKGNKKINMNPKTIQQLVDNLNKAENNAARNGYSNVSYSYEEVTDAVAEGKEKPHYFVIYGKMSDGDQDGPFKTKAEAEKANTADGKIKFGYFDSHGQWHACIEPVKEDIEQLDEKVFDNDRYDWYVWTDKKPSKMFDRRGGAKQIERGMQFGLRAATSKPGTWRMIIKAKGPSIIFSITAGDAQELIDRALELK